MLRVLELGRFSKNSSKTVFLEKFNADDPPEVGAIDRSLAATADGLVLLALEEQNTGHLLAAAQLYKGLLDDATLPMGSLKRAEIENNLGSVHCLMAQRSTEAATISAHLDKAERFLKAALKVRQHKSEPLAWAITTTNAAIVDVTRYGQTGEVSHLLNANLRLDHAANEFANQNHDAHLTWIESVRDHLLQLRKRPQA